MLEVGGEVNRLKEMKINQDDRFARTFCVFIKLTELVDDTVSQTRVNRHLSIEISWDMTSPCCLATLCTQSPRDKALLTLVPRISQHC